MTDEAALRATLELAAGAAGLPALVAQRRHARALAEARRSARSDQQALAKAARAARHDGAATPWRGWFDGSAHPNPGRCGIGALLLGPAGERCTLSHAAGHGNSSEAEYRALITLLEAAHTHGARNLTVYGDSRVVIDDLEGDDTNAAASLRELRACAKALIAGLDRVNLRWIPRHKNSDADALSQQAVAAWCEGVVSAAA